MCAPSWAVQYAIDARRLIKVSGGVVVTNLLVFAAAHPYRESGHAVSNGSLYRQEVFGMIALLRLAHVCLG
jgi:hypothetical protein